VPVKTEILWCATPCRLTKSRVTLVIRDF